MQNRVFLPLQNVMSLFDAAKGVSETGELLDKEDEELTFRDKRQQVLYSYLV